MQARKLVAAGACALAAMGGAVVSSADCPTPEANNALRKKCIAFGWEYGFVTPEQLLDNAAKFKDTAIDGVGIYLMATNRAGRPIASRGFTSGPEWDFEAFKSQLPALRKIAKTDHLKDSFLKCFDAPRKRISWLDDAAWARIGRNMGVVGRISRETGLKGINSDPEDYHHQEQYKPVPGDPPYDELIKIVRRRGQEVFGPLFREQPEARVLFYWFLTANLEYFKEKDPAAAARRNNDLWPAFADGIMDVLPPRARIVDGYEYYDCEYSTRDFHVGACTQRQLAPLLLSPENRAKHAIQVQVSFAHYLDLYVNPESKWHMGPVSGSRVEHFRRNYADSFKLADEYIWLWGEWRPTVRWENAKVSKDILKEKTWEESLPGMYEGMLSMHDADYGLRRRKATLEAKGELKDMNSNPECSPDEKSKKGGLPLPYGSYSSGGGKPVFRLDENAGEGGSSCISITGFNRSTCVTLSFKDIQSGDAFAISCRMKGGDPCATVGWKNEKQAWNWGLGKEHLTFSPPDKDGWRTGEAYFVAPGNAFGMGVTFTPNKNYKGKMDGTVYLDNVHVWKLW